MSTKVLDYLNESGGSNFTETATRPPVYGEENELQSNGGNSTKSGSSHKSQVSSKSHSSSKSGTSTKGDHSHSPAMTPRKSNLEGIKSSDAVTALSQSSLCEQGDTEMSAPLGFHPEGSAANSPPYSENGTPPHLKWAENLKYLLDDSEGVDLFKEFMDHELEGGSEELQFWFACQGLKRKIDSECSDNLDITITNIQKAIYKRYVRGDKVKCISKDVKKDIADKVSSKSTLDHCIFDTAQEEVENSMRNVTYPAFLRSDYYVQYVQNYGDSPKSSQSSGSNSARPVSQSGLLPVVHEDKELEIKDISSSMHHLPVINKVPSSKRSDSSGSTRHTETVTGSNLYMSRGSSSSYPAHVSYAPVSAQDSELQSLSSDALTDDTVSVTDSSLDGYPLHLRKKHPRKAMKSLAQQNREHRTGLTGQIIPRTEHAPKDRNIAETDPKRFADLLMEKLSKVLEEREASAKVEEKLRSISEADKSTDKDKLMSSLAKHNTSASFIPLMRTMDEETAESILDQHCSRIWASSSHHTPSYSPPGRQSPPFTGKSPDRAHKDTRTRFKGASSGTPLPPPNGANTALGSGGASGVGGRGYHRHHNKRDFGSAALSSCDSGIPDDRTGVVSCGSETHRHIHHHHHHHHSRDSVDKKSRVEMEAQTSCGPLAWRADQPQTFVDFPPPSSSGDHSASRGRISTRSKAAPSGLRKGSETSSNMDSGVSGMYTRDPWHNPNGEKVMKWMLDSETVQEVSVPDSAERSSSHKRSHRLNQSTGSTQQSRPSSRSKTSTRSTSVERSGGLLSAWGAAAPILPSQPFVQDSSMPLPTPPNPTTQLEEAKRRLESQSVTTPIKSKSFTGVLSKDKGRVPGSPSIAVPPHTRTLPSARNVPTELDTSANSQTLDSRVGRRLHNTSNLATSATASLSTSLQPSPSDTIIGIYMGQEPIPYRHQLPGRAITLAQIKTLVTKRGPFKYFFKRDSDEFGDGAVFEEITDESLVVPMWQGKIVVKVEKLDL